MKTKATIWSIASIVGGLTLAITFTHQYILADSPGKLSPSQSVSQSSTIPSSVSLNIRQDMAKRLNLKLGDVRVVKIENNIFDSCLNLPAANEKCQEIALRGWAVSVIGGKHRWLYHAVPPKILRNNFRVNGLESLPKDVRQKVISNATLLSEPPVGKIRITSVEAKEWKNNCLDLPKIYERCNSTKTPGWLITLKSDKPNSKEPPKWVYRSDLNGNRFELDIVASVGNIPEKTIADILADAAKRSQISRSLWKVERVQAVKWGNSGDDSPSMPIQGAMPNIENIFGWKVEVSSPKQQWVYFALQNGFQFDAPKSVPPYLVNEAIKMAVAQSGKPADSFKFHWAEQITWNDTCLGVTINKPACEKISVPGWTINLMGQGENSFILSTFHSRLDRDVRFNGSNPWFPPPVANPR
ncbi:hypothetical protein H6G33_14560 [Calothrix sp. FACHB-1219]|uniref:hypothetical protein n=1 Tax=unclassified Calothrix TaxID=2619626 RepID=UPI0016860161|nr:MULTISPECIES: hypothetical protein [unclassified Calothrix]MBD2203956.1 hypothetical protein [Calothrix sp. FACHB-168]MBD2218259.1 hypothetical protein [Calothrix sp. FACHB-1219]